jgi:hypothetical protein
VGNIGSLANFPIPAPGVRNQQVTLIAQVPQPLLRVETASDELGALTHDFRQSRFASLVNERHVVQINDASARVTFAASLSPGRPELGCPPTD